MTRTEMKQILDKVLDMGETNLHHVKADFSTWEKGYKCMIIIHFDAPTYSVYNSAVCAAKLIFATDDVQPVLEWLDVWAEIFRKERELDETDGH